MFTEILIAYYTNRYGQREERQEPGKHREACLFYLNTPLFLLCPHRGAFAQNTGPRVVFHFIL